jgi:hypothetical protein
MLIFKGLSCSFLFRKSDQPYFATAAVTQQPKQQQKQQQQQQQQLSSSIRRGVQEEEEESAAYLKCFDTLDAITAGAETLSQSQYVSFLSQMDSGSTPPSIKQFGDLDAVYVLIFYMTACEDPARCAPGIAPPTIPIGDTSNPSDNLRMLCRAVLRHSQTSINAMFQYSIQYDASEIDISKLGECLSTATVNALLDAVDCEPLTAIRRSSTRRQRRDDEREGRYIASFSNFIEIIGDGRSQGRDLQVGDLVTSEDSESSCAYLITSFVEDVENVGTNETHFDRTSGPSIMYLTL